MEHNMSTILMLPSVIQQLPCPENPMDQAAEGLYVFFVDCKAIQWRNAIKSMGILQGINLKQNSMWDPLINSKLLN